MSYGSMGLLQPLATAQANLEQLEAHTARVERLTEALGTAQDSENVRNELRQLREACHELIRETSGLLQAHAQEEGGSRIIQAFAAAVSRLKHLAQASLQRERTVPLRRAGPEGPAGDLQAYAARQEQLQLQAHDLDLVEVTELELDNRIIQERNDGLHDVKEKLQDLKEVTIHVARITDEQTQLFDQAEVAADKANRQTEKVLKQLTIAGKKQNASRYKMSFIVGCILVGVLIVFLIIAAKVAVIAAAA